MPLTAFIALLMPLFALGQQSEDHSGHAGHQMSIQPSGTVMNENLDRLPRDCSEISREYAITIQAGRDYADDVPGMIFGMSEHEILVEPCSRIEVTFVNEDEVRHQWMVHGLPRYLYPAGMFHIEASGGHRQTGTLIVPGDNRTYLIHCDIAQHMEKGMRGQLVVGSGSGDLWGVPGVSGDFLRAPYLPRFAPLLAGGVLLIAFLGSLRLIRKFCH